MKTLNRKQLYLITGIVSGLALIIIYLFGRCIPLSTGITLPFAAGALCGIAFGLADGTGTHKPKTGLFITLGTWIIACAAHFLSLNSPNLGTLYSLYLLQLAVMMVPWALALYLSTVVKHDSEKWL